MGHTTSHHATADAICSGIQRGTTVLNTKHGTATFSTAASCLTAFLDVDTLTALTKSGSMCKGGGDTPASHTDLLRCPVGASPFYRTLDMNLFTALRKSSPTMREHKIRHI